MQKLTDAKKYLSDTLAMRKSLELGFLSLAERLHAIYSKELWKGAYTTYQEFLAEMRFSESTDSKLRAIYVRFVSEYKLPLETLSAIGWTELYLIASKIGNKERALALLSQAPHLRKEELESAIRSETSGEHVCEGEIWKMMKCAVCKKLTRMG